MTSIITDVGLEIVARRMKGQWTEPLYIAWGIGTTAPLKTDTALDSEDVSGGYARVPGVSTIVTVVELNDCYQVSGSITATAALTITEWGLFDANVVGHMLCREVQAPGYTLVPGGILNFVFKIQNSRCNP